MGIHFMAGFVLAVMMNVGQIKDGSNHRVS